MHLHNQLPKRKNKVAAGKFHIFATSLEKEHSFCQFSSDQKKGKERKHILKISCKKFSYFGKNLWGEKKKKNVSFAYLW